MKIYTKNGKTWKGAPPNPLTLDDGTFISPVSDADFVAAGGEITENGEPTHMEELLAAEETFRQVCAAIGEFIDDPTFRGGINDMSELAESEAAQENPVQALMLSERWNGADKACNHFASKSDVNLQSPKWWYHCWGLPIPE